jgi:hypothetical protein
LPELLDKLLSQLLSVPVQVLALLLTHHQALLPQVELVQ